MIDVFEKFAPKYQKIVRSYAHKIWLGEDSQDLEERFIDKTEEFSLKYKRALQKFYKKQGIKIYQGTIEAKVNQWVIDQKGLVSYIKEIASDKKSEAKTELLSKIYAPGKTNAQKVLDEINGGQKEFNFNTHMKKRADQIGEQAAFDLGADVNNKVVEESGDTYKWQTQEDKKVRKTHRKLNNKIFSYTSDPTTIDKYGNKHTGPPGTDYGCRCYAVLTKGKPLLNYVVRE